MSNERGAAASGTESTGRLVDHLFRREASRIVAALARSLGPAHLDLAEEAVQEAMIRALGTWPHRGIPDRPGAWLHRVAHNHALDRLRRERAFETREDRIRHERGGGAASGREGEPRLAGELSDDQLRLIFLCSHPELPREARVGLTLKLVCGLGVAEIARGFLDREATVAQRLVRAKRLIRERRLPLEVPGPDALPERLDSVLEVLYLTFNEGYAVTSGHTLVRYEVCAEALRLGEELTRPGDAIPTAEQPRIHALAALFCFQASRLPARTDATGEAVLLADQDRRLWDPHLLRRGFAHLERSATGPELSAYHLEAAIASHHAAAPSWQATDWPAILALYDELLVLVPSPVIALNRAVALGEAEGPGAALAALAEIEADPEAAGALATYHLLPATKGVLLLRAGRPDAAVRAFRRALAQCPATPERRLLEKRLAAARMAASRRPEAREGLPPGRVDPGHHDRS